MTTYDPQCLSPQYEGDLEIAMIINFWINDAELCADQILLLDQAGEMWGDPRDIIDLYGERDSEFWFETLSQYDPDLPTIEEQISEYLETDDPQSFEPTLAAMVDAYHSGVPIYDIIA